MDKVKAKEKARIFFDNKIPAFISNTRGDFFFCNVKNIHDDYIVVIGFAGKRRGELDRLLYLDIERFEEYKELSEVKA